MKIYKNRDGQYYWNAKFPGGITGNYYEPTATWGGSLWDYLVWRIRRIQLGGWLR